MRIKTKENFGRAIKWTGEHESFEAVVKMLPQLDIDTEGEEGSMEEKLLIPIHDALWKVHMHEWVVKMDDGDVIIYSNKEFVNKFVIA